MITVLSNVQHEMAWGIGIVLYFFIGSLSAGAFILSTLPSVFGLKKYEKIGRIAAFTAFILITLAPLILIADLEQPLRFLHVLYMFNPTSALSWGSLILMLYSIICLAYVLLHLKISFLHFREDKRLLKTVGAIGIPFAVALSIYPGILLGVVKARALWHSALTPPIFFMSAILSGIAIMILIAYVLNTFLHHRVDSKISAQLGRFLFWGLIIELILISFELTILLNSTSEAIESAMLLLTGSLSLLFVGIYIVLCTLIPLTILGLYYKKGTMTGNTVSSILVLTGVFMLRYILVIGGQMIPLS